MIDPDLTKRMNESLKRHLDHSLTPHPWPNEPLRGEWIIEMRWTHAGLECLIMARPLHDYEKQRSPYKDRSRCGYVRVPIGHPDHGKLNGDVDVHVHGGLTFNQVSPDGEWFGFDTAHLGDDERPWGIRSVQYETEHLAEQFAERGKAAP